MTKLTMVQLLLTANALIRVLELKAPNEQGEKELVVIADDATEEDVLKIIEEAVGYIEPRDEPQFTLEEKALINTFSPELYKDAAAKLEKLNTKTKKEAPVVKKEEVQVDDPEKTDESEKETTLLNEVKDAQRLATLKDIATANDEFKSIRGKLSSYKTAAILKDAMLKMLNEGKEEEQEKAEEIHEKNIEGKAVNEIKGEDKEPAEIPEKPAKPIKEKKEKVVKPEGSKTRAGIFAEIYAEGVPLTMSEWSEQMNLRYSSDSLAGAKTFTSLYMQILLELGFVTKKDGKFVKAGKK